jgi:hypothetical protein
MIGSTDPVILIGVAQVLALTGIFVRLGKTIEKSETNRQKITKLYERIRRLENHV